MWVSEKLKKPSEPIKKIDFLSSTSIFIDYIRGSLNYKNQKMSDTITIYSPVFSICFEDPDDSELYTVPAGCMAEADAVVALRNSILKQLQEFIELSDAEVERIQQSNTAKELALVLGIKSCAEFVTAEDTKNNQSSICYEHTMWVDFKLNKQEIKLPSKPDDKPESPKRQRIN